jgi:hypothetical protein
MSKTTTKTPTTTPTTKSKGPRAKTLVAMLYTTIATKKWTTTAKGPKAKTWWPYIVLDGGQAAGARKKKEEGRERTGGAFGMRDLLR